MNLEAVKPGSIIKYNMPKDPFFDESGGEKIFQVKAVDQGKMYGTELKDIDKEIKKETPYSEKPSFEIIA